MHNASVNYDKTQSVSQAVNTRRSLRAFLPKSVETKVITRLLEQAARAPSGTNMQPWKSYVVRAKTRQVLCDAVCAAFDDPAQKPVSEMRYYPEHWFEPYVSRRREVGWSLYGLLGIKKGDHARTHAQHRRNFQFFDAPVGMIFTIDRDLATGSWLDYGMYLQNIMLLAREQGLHTCPQAAWADYHNAVRGVLPITPQEIIVCGMSLGYADPDAIENSLVTTRVPVEQQVIFLE